MQPSPAASEQALQSTLDSAYHHQKPFRTLWRLFAGQHRALAFATFWYAIKQSPVWVFPIATGNIINEITDIYASRQANHPPADPHAVRWIIINAVTVSILILQNIPTHTIYTWYLSSAVRNVQLLLRSALVVRLQQLSMSFHDNVQAGKLQSKVLRDVEAVEGLCRLLLDYVFQGIIILTVSLVVTLQKQPRITFFFIFSVPAAVGLMRLFGQQLKDRNEEFRREVESMSGRVSEMIEMIPITRAHAVEQTEVDRLHGHLHRIRSAGQKLDKTNNLFGAAIWATFQFFQVVCLCFNVWQCYLGKIRVGDIVLFQSLFGMVVGVVQQAAGIMPSFTSGMESIRSIAEVLESPDVENNEGKSAVSAVQGRFDFEEVSFTYPNTERPALNHFTFGVKAGECIAVVGESGSGKSTLMNLIIGFRRPLTGRILLDGVDMATINFRSFRRFLAVVPQQTILFSGSVRENITYGLTHVTEQELQHALDMANCTEFVSKLPDGLDTLIGSHGGKLSGGQRQRIAIARALLRDPRVIILDEATSALDVVSEELVQQAINRLIKGRTTFIVAHRLSTIRNADRVVVMANGHLLESGPQAELLADKDSAFSKLHSLQL